jgi:hypothetical protein
MTQKSAPQTGQGRISPRVLLKALRRMAQGFEHVRLSPLGTSDAMAW